MIHWTVLNVNEKSIRNLSEKRYCSEVSWTWENRWCRLITVKASVFFICSEALYAVPDENPVHITGCEPDFSFLQYHESERVWKIISASCTPHFAVYFAPNLISPNCFVAKLFLQYLNIWKIYHYNEYAYLSSPWTIHKILFRIADFLQFFHGQVQKGKSRQPFEDESEYSHFHCRCQSAPRCLLLSVAVHPPESGCGNFS